MYYQYFLGCTKGDIQRQKNPGAGCCATDLTPATPANSWFDCFLMCEKRQRENQDCEYFEFMDLNYAGMTEQRVAKTKNCKIIISNWISVVNNRNHCVLKKDITGFNTVSGVSGGFLNDCKSKYVLNSWNNFMTALSDKKGHTIYI